MFCDFGLRAWDGKQIRDPQSAMDPLRVVFNGDLTTGQDYPDFENTATLYTIHNIQYQGRSPREVMELINAGYEHFYAAGPFEYYDQVNLMKAGLVYADLCS